MKKFLEADVQYPEKLHQLPNDYLQLPNYHFYLKEWKLKKIKNLVANCMVKLIKRYRHKKFKVSIKSWISFEKSS